MEGFVDKLLSTVGNGSISVQVSDRCKMECNLQDIHSFCISVAEAGHALFYQFAVNNG